MSYLGFKANRENSAMLPRTGKVSGSGIKQHAQIGGNPLAQGTVAYGSPKFYSPLHTPSNWQIPTKRREVYLWCRFFAANEPRVASALDIYSQLPVTEFENICDDEAVTAYFDDLVRRIKLSDYLNKIAYEYFCIGDVFVFANIACEACAGSGITPGSQRKDGSYIPCAHEGGTFHSLTLLNPDWIEVVTSSITEEEILFLVPGNDVKNIVQRQSPPELYNRIPDFVKQAVMLGKPIQLHPLCSTHLAHNPSGNNPYGRSLISRLFRTLAYKDKIIQAQWIAADRHILPVRIVKVGNDNIPANEQDIQYIQNQLLQVSQDPTVTLVTHHAVDYDFVGASGKVMQLGKEYDMIDQEILDGLMINKALLNGEGPTYNSAAVGLEAFIKRLDNFRNILKRFIEEKIYRPVAMMQGFTTRNERNEEVLLYPEVRFKEMRLRDDTQQKNLLMQMVDKKYISRQTFLEYFNIDFNIEINRLRMENILQSEYNLNEDEEGGGGGMGGGMDMGGGGGGMPDLGGGPEGGDDMGLGDMGGGPPPGPEASMPNLQGQPQPQAAQARYSPIGKPVVTRKIQKIQKQRKPTKQELEAMKPNKLVLNIPEQKIFQAIEKLQKDGVVRQSFVPQYKPCRERKFVLDFAFPKIKLGIEVDGPLHDTPEKVNEDKLKDQYLGERGWKIIRFKEKDINNHFDDIILPNLNEVINNRIKELSPPA